jgi:hypothetical protein
MKIKNRLSLARIQLRCYCRNPKLDNHKLVNNILVYKPLYHCILLKNKTIQLISQGRKAMFSSEVQYYEEKQKI